MIKITQESFNKFLNNQKLFASLLNHRMSKIELDVNKIKKIAYYTAGALSVAIGKFLIGI